MGPQTRSAVADINAEQLLQRLRTAREQYERTVVRRDESSKFWRGLVNRWDNALATARKFGAEEAAPCPGSIRTPPTPSARAGWVGALIAAVRLVVLQAEADRRTRGCTRKARGPARRVGAD